MSDSDTRTSEGRVSRNAAEVYEEFFVPALFGEWAPRVADAAGIRTGAQVLDVACGTGVLAREAARRVGPDGRVVGVDVNPDMLGVARRLAPELEWLEASAEDLPIPDGAFDAVVSQFGLMFIRDRVRALREMWRVAAPGGRLAVAVCGPLDGSPGYAALVDLLDRLFGKAIADEMKAPFALGDADELHTLFVRAGIDDVTIETRPGAAHFASVDAWMHTDVKGWTLADRIDEPDYLRLLQAARTDLAEFVRDDGSVTFPFPAHVATAQKPGAS